MAKMDLEGPLLWLIFRLCFVLLFYWPVFAPVYFQQRQRDQQDALWRKTHPFPNVKILRRVFILAPETFREQEQQLREIHHDYEFLWPVVVEVLPARNIDPETQQENQPSEALHTSVLYADLTCSYCQTPGSLVDGLPELVREFRDSPTAECPCCKHISVFDSFHTIEGVFPLVGETLCYSCERWHKWLQRFSGFEAPRSETAVCHLNDRQGIRKGKPFRMTNPFPKKAPQIWLLPDHTYEIHLKTIPDESAVDTDQSVAHLGRYEIIKVIDLGTDRSTWGASNTVKVTGQMSGEVIYP